MAGRSDETAVADDAEDADDAEGPGRATVEHLPNQPDVSVVLTTDGGSAWLGSCLRSLAAQTLPVDRFEVVVVQHGPEDGTAAAVRRARADHPALPVTHLTLDATTRASAKNVGLAAARGQWVTFVRDDDRLSPNLLHALVDRCGDGTVAIGLHVDVPARGRPAVFDSPRLDRVVRFQGRPSASEPCRRHWARGPPRCCRSTWPAGSASTPTS